MRHRPLRRSVLACLLGVLAGACNRSTDEASPEGLAPPRPRAVGPAVAAGPRVVFLGDSLTAGYGLAQEEAFPALVADALRERGVPIDVVNAGVSGDTSAGGRARLAWILRQRPALLVVCLGVNDALRGQPLSGIADNLRVIVREARAAGAAVLLLGMKLPPSYGAAYAQGFERVYADVARELDVPLVPFLLEGVGGERALNQPDGIHPTAEGQRIVARTVLPHVERLLTAER